MTSQPDSSALSELENHLGADWSAIRAARVRTRETREKISAANLGIPSDCAFVVFGSLARGEATERSDVDWTLLVDGQSFPTHLTAAQEIDARLKAIDLIEPTPTGAFGGLAFSHDLIHNIGGEDDTNSNTTRRLLLLLESAAIGDYNVHVRVIRQILKRYVTEDFGLAHNRTDGVPRFLLNDIVRYWRTMAVDFAYKRRVQQTRGWALRTVKLRLSRKLIYVSGMLACFGCEELGTDNDPEGRTIRVVEQLESHLRRAPLDSLAEAVLAHINVDGFAHAARNIFDSYDSFLRLLSDADKREQLKSLTPDDAANNPLYETARQLGKTFQSGLDTVFLQPAHTSLYYLTRKYGVF